MICYSLKYPKSQEKKMCGGAIINKVAWNMNCIVYVFDPIHLVYPPGLATWTSPTHMTYLPDIPTWPTHMTCPPDIQSWKFHNTCNVFTLCLLFPALCSLCSALFLRWEEWGELHLEWRGERLVMVMRVMLPVMVVSWVNTAKIFDSWKFESGSDDDKF